MIKFQTLCDLLENPEDMTRTSVPVLSDMLGFLPRFDPCPVSLFQNFEPWEILSGGAECGTETDAPFNPFGDPGAEREAPLVCVVRVGTGTLVEGGELYRGSGFDPPSMGVSFLGGEDIPVRTGVAADGVDGPEEESSLFSLSPWDSSFSLTRSSSSSNTGSVVCGRSSWCDNELLDMLRDLLAESGRVLVEKSHESKVLWDAEEVRLSRS